MNGEGSARVTRTAIHPVQDCGVTLQIGARRSFDPAYWAECKRRKKPAIRVMMARKYATILWDRDPVWPYGQPPKELASQFFDLIKLAVREDGTSNKARLAGGTGYGFVKGIEISRAEGLAGDIARALDKLIVPRAEGTS